MKFSAPEKTQLGSLRPISEIDQTLHSYGESRGKHPKQMLSDYRLAPDAASRSCGDASPHFAINSPAKCTWSNNGANAPRSAIILTMARKPKPPPDDPEQLKRFKEMAREVEADESEGAMDRAFDKVIKPKKSSITQTQRS